MRKKVALSIAAAAMVGTLAVGGTLAWFTDTETATNVVTMGNVDVKLSEAGEGTGMTEGSGLTYTDIMPGKEYIKSAMVENVGNDAYVRAILTVSSSKKDVIDEFLKKNGFEIVGLEEDVEWTAVGEDGKQAQTTLYYNDNDVFKSGAEWNLFDGFAIPASWGNEFEGADFNIKIDVEAIQSDNIEAGAAWDTFDTVENPDSGKTDDAVGEVVDEIMPY